MTEEKANELTIPEEFANFEADWNIPEELGSLSELTDIQFTTGIVVGDYHQITDNKYHNATTGKSKFVIPLVLIFGGILLFIFVLEMIARATIYM